MEEAADALATVIEQMLIAFFGGAGEIVSIYLTTFDLVNVIE